MNLLDILLGIIISLFVIRGVLKGFFKEGIGLAGVILGLVIGINRYEDLGRAISKEFGVLSLKTSNIMAFIVIFGGIAVLGAITGIVIHDVLSRRSLTRGIEGVGGFILGLAEGALICSIILILLTLSPLAGKVNSWSKGSILKPYLVRIGPFVYDSIVSVTPGKAKKFIEKFDPFELQPSDFKLDFN